MNNIKDFGCKIDEAIKEFDMVSQGDTIIVGVSGGSDSICLLSYLLKIKDEKNLKIIVAHVNHMLRGKESERDENFVKNFCKEKKLPIKVLRIDVASESKTLGLGIEESGRKIRYDFFKKLALEEVKCTHKQNPNTKVKIATAHTLSDSVETIILNLAKGTSVDGLCGIPPVREVILNEIKNPKTGEFSKLKIIRPLIYLKKIEILEYCKINELKFIEDSSNFEDKYTRNKIRLKVLPILKEINDNLETSIARSVKLFKKDSTYLNKVASKELENLKIKGKENQYSLLGLKNLDFAIKSRCVKKMVENFSNNVRLDFRHLNLILEMIEKGEGAVMLPSKVYLKVNDDILKVSKFEEKSRGEKVNFSYLVEKNKLKPTYILTERNLKVIIEVVTKSEYDKFKNVDLVNFKNAIDFDKIPKSELYFRNRREFDKFSPINRKITKSLKKFLNEEKVPLEKRDSSVMLASENVIIWLENFGVSEKFKVNENTKNVMILKFEKLA